MEIHHILLAKCPVLFTIKNTENKKTKRKGTKRENLPDLEIFITQAGGSNQQRENVKSIATLSKYFSITEKRLPF